MDLIVVLFVLVNAVALILLPRRWAPLPLIVGACYMTRGQALELGSISLTVVRLLVAAGFARLLIRREWVRGGVNGLDGLMVVWGVWMVASVAFHPEPDATFTLRARDLYEAWGLYLLFRVFCQSREDIRDMASILAVALAPIAVFMVVEKMTGVNAFAQFGGVPVMSAVRNGVVRAQGPFTHALLAGSIGGVCLPLVAGLWQTRRALAILGSIGCMAIVLASGSSGPLLTVGAGLAVWALWRLRERMRLIKWAAVLAYLGLEIGMNRPAYFIIADVDLMGGSTSWYRAELIRSAIAHLDEWWLAGTDVTRHWMPSGVISGPNQTDITNHYIAMGVVGGLPLLILFVAMVVKGFNLVGDGIRSEPNGEGACYTWSVGAALFAHAVTCLSISYYDHSIMFLYLTLAATTATQFPEPALAAVPAPRLATAAGTLPAARPRRRWQLGVDVPLAAQRHEHRSPAVRRWVMPDAGVPSGGPRDGS